MASKIIPYTGQPLQTGDILVVRAVLHTNIPWIEIKHYAIVYQKNGIQYIAEHKPITQGLKTQPLLEYLNKRTVIGIVRNEKTMALTDEYIEQKTIDCEPTSYRVLTYNCEDFIRDICDCDVGFDQRKKWGIISASIIFIFIVLYFLMKKYDHPKT